VWNVTDLRRHVPWRFDKRAGKLSVVIADSELWHKPFCWVVCRCGCVVEGSGRVCNVYIWSSVHRACCLLATTPAALLTARHTSCWTMSLSPHWNPGWRANLHRCKPNGRQVTKVVWYQAKSSPFYSPGNSSNFQSVFWLEDMTPNFPFARGVRNLIHLTYCVSGSLDLWQESLL